MGDSFGDHEAKFVPHTYIEGIEVTQAIQYYRALEHLSDPLDRGPDNSLLLVARKSAYVRVHLVPGQSAPTQFVTGDVTVTRYKFENGIKFEGATTLTPVDGDAFVDPNGDYAQRRSTPNQSLNFVIPAAVMEGKLRIEARIWYAGHSPIGEILSEKTIRVDATHIQSLPIRAVFISYDGPDGMGNQITVPAASMADVLQVATDALAMFPVESVTRFSSAGEIPWNLPFNDQPEGACTKNYDALMTRLATVRMLDGNRQDVIYFGVIPVGGVPIGEIIGCGYDGLATTNIDDAPTFAHEVGHALGLPHTPGCDTDGSDPNYPAYEPYDNASSPRGFIGEYGLDIRSGAVHPPRVFDFMNYCSPQWISIYNYRYMEQHAKLVRGSTETKLRIPVRFWNPYWPKWKDLPDPTPRWMDRSWTVRPQRLISITGSVRHGRVIDPIVVRVESVPILRGELTNWTAALLSVNGEMLTEANLVSLGLSPSCKCGRRAAQSDDFTFHALLQDVAPGARLTIHRTSGDERREVWSIDAPKRKLEVSRLRATAQTDAVMLQWNCVSGDPSVCFSVQFSNDDCESWHCAKALINQRECLVPLARLPEGPVTFRVLAHDGFHTVSVGDAGVTVPAVKPAVAVLSPTKGQEVMAGHPLLLWLASVDQNGEPASDETCTWELDGKEIAKGSQAVIQAPAAGRHTATAVLNSRAGRIGSTVTFVTTSEESAPLAPLAE